MASILILYNFSCWCSKHFLLLILSVSPIVSPFISTDVKMNKCIFLTDSLKGSQNNKISFLSLCLGYVIQPHVSLFWDQDWELPWSWCVSIFICLGLGLLVEEKKKPVMSPWSFYSETSVPLQKKKFFFLLITCHPTSRTIPCIWSFCCCCYSCSTFPYKSGFSRSYSSKNNLQSQWITQLWFLLYLMLCGFLSYPVFLLRSLLPSGA
jgi:hypothetical protein